MEDVLYNQLLSANDSLLNADRDFHQALVANLKLQNREDLSVSQIKQCEDDYLSNYKQTIDDYESLISVYGTAPDLYYNLANAYFKDKNFAKAILNEEYIETLDDEQKKYADQINRRTEFKVLTTTWGIK